MSQHLCIRLIKKLLQIFLFQSFKNRPILLIVLDSQNLTTYNQSTILKRVNTQFQLENHISGIASLVPKINKSLLFINLSYNKIETALSRQRTRIFLG